METVRAKYYSNSLQQCHIRRQAVFNTTVCSHKQKDAQRLGVGTVRYPEVRFILLNFVVIELPLFSQPSCFMIMIMITTTIIVWDIVGSASRAVVPITHQDGSKPTFDMSMA